MGLVLTSQALEESRKINEVDQTFKLIDRALLKPISMMREFYPKCPNFVKSLWPQQNIFSQKTENLIEDDKACILDLSIVMMQCFEDHFTGDVFDSTGNIVWAGNFLQWTSSDTFLEMWKSLYPNFKNTTNEYTKLLFEYSNKNGKIKDADDLEKRCNQFVSDQRIKNIYLTLRKL